MIGKVNGSLCGSSFCAAKTQDPAASDTAKTLKASAAKKSKKAKEPVKEWTVMYYGAAYDELEMPWIENLNEMESVGSRDNLNIVSQLDLKSSGCKRYYIEKDDNMNKLTSPVVEDMGGVYMSDPKVLSDFIEFSIKNKPAQHYALILASHGHGWRGLRADKHYKLMSVSKIRQALEKAEKKTGKKIDLLCFDACLMASTEVAYELKDNAKYMVASEQIEVAKTWTYDKILKEAFEKIKHVSPKKFAEIIVNESSKVKHNMLTTSAIDLSKMKGVASASNKLAKNILKTTAPNKKLPKFSEIIRHTQGFEAYVFIRDHYHFAEQILNSQAIIDKKLKKCAKNLMKAIENAVIAEQHSVKVPPRELLTDLLTEEGINKLDNDKEFKEEIKAIHELNNSHGLTIDLAPDENEQAYSTLKFNEDTQWLKAMEEFWI